MKKILFVHLLNNYTGSPTVLANLLKCVNSKKEYNIKLLTSNTEGTLSNLENITYYSNHYIWINNKVLLIIFFFISQIYQFLFVIFSNKNDTVYINTILPFGAAIGARLRHCRVIYHIHEFFNKPNLLHRICIKTAQFTADEVIFVSQYLQNSYSKVFTCETSVIYNSVSENLHNYAVSAGLNGNKILHRFDNKTIIMPCSLKKYKGLFQFVTLAELLPAYKFILVISDTRENIEKFFVKKILPLNLKILSNVSNMSDLYDDSSLVVNLSLPYGKDFWIETFGMTIIEGFEFGIPCIAPNYGGPREIINDNFNGFLVDPFDIEYVKSRIVLLMESFGIYNKFSQEAIKRANCFSPYYFSASIEKIISLQRD